MSDDIWIKHNLGTFQQPYIFQQNRNRQTPVIAQKVGTTPAIARQPSTYQHRVPTTYRNPVNAQEPNIRSAQEPNIRSAQEPNIRNQQEPNIRSGQTPFTYNFRSPFTYRNPVSYQLPFTYQHRSPFTYRNPVGYQLPFTYNFRSPGTYRNPVNRQSPFINQGRTPVIYSYRSPFNYDTPYSYRTPYIFTQADTYANEYDVSAYSAEGDSSGSLTLKVWMDNINGVFPRDIRVSGELDVGGEEESYVYALNGSNVYTYDNNASPETTGTDPSALVYHIDDILVDGYTVRRTQSFTGDSLFPSTPSGCSSLTATAQNIFYSTGTNSGKRGVQYNAVAVNDFVSGTLNGSLIFEKSGSTTYTYSYTFYYQVEAEEGDCPQCCIHEDMLVSTPEGDKHIDNIKAGDFIYGYNFETKQKEETQITRIKRLERDNIIKINDTIVTDDHPVFLIDGSLASARPEATLKNYHKEVDKLEVGDKILDVNGNHIVVNSIEPYAGEHRVYTIKTELDNFYADNILVDSVLRNKYKTEVNGQWSQS